MIATILLRDNALQTVGEVEDFEELKVILRFNGVNTWELRGWTANDLFNRQTTNGIILRLDQARVMSGPIWAYKQHWIREPASNVYNLGGVSDDFWMTARVLLPVITGPPYTAAAYDIANLPAESLMHYYVNRNAGPGAKPERRVFGLTMGANQARGGNIHAGGRFHMLSSVLNAVSIINASKGLDEIGWRVVQVGATHMEFQTFVPPDLSGIAKFSADFGNLDEFQYDDTGPLVNYAYVGGGGEGTARTFTEGWDGASMARWGRVEAFVDQRQTTVIEELAQARDEALLDGKGSTALALVPVDTDQLQYGRDYNLGDKVTVVVGGVPIIDVIREVELTITSDGQVRAQPKVGTADQRGPIDLFRQMREVRNRIRNLETR